MTLEELEIMKSYLANLCEEVGMSQYDIKTKDRLWIEIKLIQKFIKDQTT